MNSRLINLAGPSLEIYRRLCLSCNPTTINRGRETREFGVQPTMQAQPLEELFMKQIPQFAEKRARAHVF
jgi:hypothetical protein